MLEDHDKQLTGLVRLKCEIEGMESHLADCVEHEVENGAQVEELQTLLNEKKDAFKKLREKFEFVSRSLSERIKLD